MQQTKQSHFDIIKRHMIMKSIINNEIKRGTHKCDSAKYFSLSHFNARVIIWVIYTTHFIILILF